uniref:Si:dkey-9i23.8 n=1 Tax=Maylandia zebra TaxID=106582 RepID=A0A3P9AQX9_9CICH
MTMGVMGNSLALLVKVLLLISSSMLTILTGGQKSPWCEVVTLLKFVLVSSSIGSTVLCVQRSIGINSIDGAIFVVMVTACLASWVTGVVFGSIPVVYAWIYDPAETLCTVFWESSSSDMLVYNLCAFSICIFFPLLLIFGCSVIMATGDLSKVTPLLGSCCMICYTPFFVSELILLAKMDLSPAPDFLRTLSTILSYLDCGLNPLIYFSHEDFREAGLTLLWNKRKPMSAVPVLTAITKYKL